MIVLAITSALGSAARRPMAESHARDECARSLRRRRACLVAALVLSIGTCAVADRGVRLEHEGRYNRQADGRDHLVGALPILGHYALTCSFDGLRVIDLSALTPGEGTSAFVSERRGYDVYSLEAFDEEFVFANLRLGGFGVVRIDPVTKAIHWLTTIAEEEVFYEDMAVAGDTLFVAAHAYGLRVFDVSQPAQPVPIGSLTEGFADAFAIEVVGSAAYVADGAGGLKILDVSDPAAMRIVAGESVGSSALGTAEDVLVVGDDVFVAAGSAGVLSYENGDLAKRRRFETPGVAIALSKVGEFLAVAHVGGVTLMEIGPQATLTAVASEGGLRRQLPTGDPTLRLWHGVAAWGDDRVVAANWDSVDVYRIVPDASATQPDATLTEQRLRFPIAGGGIDVLLRNDGGATLEVASITSSAPGAFSVAPSGPLTLPPGASLPITIAHLPGGASQALVTVVSNDPDEAALPIEVFGNTPFPDPGDVAPAFTLPMWSYDHESRTFAQSIFSLADRKGTLVYLQVFGTWCPACLPVVADIQNSLAAPFADHPQVTIAMMSQKESAAVLERYWRNVYLRAPMLFDLSGATSFVAYAQPPSGLPFSRGFLIGADGVIEETWFGFDADRVKEAIDARLREIAIPGDLDLDGWVDAADLAVLLGAWGPCAGCAADLDGDGAVGAADLALLLGGWWTSRQPS